jgi:hypothetical protein
MFCRPLPCVLSPLAFIFSFFTTIAHIWYSYQYITLATVTNSFSVTYFGKKWSQYFLVRIIICCFEDGRTHFLARVRDFFFLFTKVSTPSLGARPASYSLRTRSCLRGVKRPGRKADHSPPPHAGIKNAWLYPYSLIHFHVLVRSEIQGHPIAFSVTRLCAYVWADWGGLHECSSRPYSSCNLLCIGSGSQNVVHFVTCTGSAGTRDFAMIRTWVYCM